VDTSPAQVTPRAMFRALGISDDLFDPNHPHRLCRGRERWIEHEPLETPVERVQRLVISGATFSDMRAHDASRGLVRAGVDAGGLLAAIFPGAPLAAFCEAGDPRALPPTTWSEEDWSQPLEAGRRRVPAVRWIAPCAPAQVSAWMHGPREDVPESGGVPRADGFLVGVTRVTAELQDALFALVGQQALEDRPWHRYDPTAIPRVLAHASALVLLHEDKHEPALAIYTKDPTEAIGAIEWVARQAGALPVPFTFPPMLARWDKALHMLQLQWDPGTEGEFPVPPAEDTRPWRNRGAARRAQEQASSEGAEE
jgi:hypothetical protein